MDARLHCFVSFIPPRNQSSHESNQSSYPQTGSPRWWRWDTGRAPSKCSLLFPIYIFYIFIHFLLLTYQSSPLTRASPPPDWEPTLVALGHCLRKLQRYHSAAECYQVGPRLAAVY